MASLLQLPHGGYELQIDGRPRILRSAELNNSSLSSAEYMKHIWPKLKDVNVDTALGAVSWEQVEPEEGRFDFGELDKVIKDAEEYGIKLVLLWFGAYKNGTFLIYTFVPGRKLMRGMSTYAPSWVKRDPKRFPRARIRNGPSTRPVEVLSLFDPNAVEADANAFKKLNEHLRRVDKNKTVIFIQVENEVGLLGDSRDRLDSAINTFDSKVPRDFIEKLENNTPNLNRHLKENLQHWKEGKHGTWSEVFGESKQIDELFMAYHYAMYIEKVALAGKSINPDMLMYTNAWLRNPDPAQPGEIMPMDGAPAGGQQPGDYPSGGPIETVLDIYRLFAPSLSFLSPDIYCKSYDYICKEWTFGSSALFIPEQAGDEKGCLDMWIAIGRYGSIGCSPFGIDYAVEKHDTPLAKHYQLLQTVEPIILRARRRGKQMEGISFPSFKKGTDDPCPTQTITMGTWKLSIDRANVFGHPGPGYGVIIHQSDDTFLLIGEGYRVVFTSTQQGKEWSGVCTFTEKQVAEDGSLRSVRLLNGDETLGGKWAQMPGPDPGYNGVRVWVLAPSRTKIAEVTAYTI